MYIQILFQINLKSFSMWLCLKIDKWLDSFFSEFWLLVIAFLKYTVVF